MFPARPRSFFRHLKIESELPKKRGRGSRNNLQRRGEKRDRRGVSAGQIIQANGRLKRLGNFGLRTIDASGTFGIRIDGKNPLGKNTLVSATIQNAHLRWRLTDRIDANSARQFKWTGGGYGQVVGGLIECSIGDLLGDKTLGASFDIQIFFEEDFDRSRSIQGAIKGHSQ